ncbi:glycosyltransferase, group 1 family protein [Flammeovirgaceae bacterium 311]|nr:glycosyltransferase, group 1 family protein [Flammeovirgaceae bacterium 311]
MQKLTYISNLAVNKTSGGGFGVNAATFASLQSEFDVKYIGPVSPVVREVEQYFSKVQKLLRLPRNYYFYSDSRLSQVRDELQLKLATSLKAPLFFHGITPWIKYKPEVAYFVHTDACFASYVDVFNNGEIFRKKDIARIIHLERSWLDSATAVFFRSTWAMNETVRLYELAGKNFHVTGVGGFADFPEHDSYCGGYNFVFISKEFIPKGGQVAVDAFLKVQQVYPEATLTIIGDEPSAAIKERPGVVCTGMLWKEKQVDKKSFQHILTGAFAHIHPTTKDTNTLVIAETSYYGCPSIAPLAFGMADQIVDGETGFLLQTPIEIEDLKNKMLWMIEHEEIYLKMRKQARAYARLHQTWEGVGKKISSIIQHTL